MNSSSVNEDKLKKLSPLYRGCLDRWLSQVRAGRSLLDSILEIRKECDGELQVDDDDDEVQPHDRGLSLCHQKFRPDLQEKCSSLLNVAQKFGLILKDLEAVAEKVSALAELAHLSFSQSFTPTRGQQQDGCSNELTADEILKVSRNLEAVVAAHRDQSTLMLMVAQNVGVCKTLDQSVFCAALWTHQPCLDQNFFVADLILKEIF